MSPQISRKTGTTLPVAASSRNRLNVVSCIVENSCWKGSALPHPKRKADMAGKNWENEEKGR